MSKENHDVTLCVAHSCVTPICSVVFARGGLNPPPHPHLLEKFHYIPPFPTQNPEGAQYYDPPSTSELINTTPCQYDKNALECMKFEILIKIGASFYSIV